MKNEKMKNLYKAYKANKAQKDFIGQIQETFKCFAIGHIKKWVGWDNEIAEYGFLEWWTCNYQNYNGFLPEAAEFIRARTDMDSWMAARMGV